MSTVDRNVTQIRDKFSGIFEEELISEILNSAKVIHLAEEESLIDINDKIEFLPLVLSGSIKIMTEDQDGKELLLYYLENGDTCAVTINCCTRETRSKVRAVAEQKATIVLVPVENVELWMAKYSSWRHFILETYNYRMTELLTAIDSLAFNNMESRILKYLRDKAMVLGSKEMHCTHLEIANDLHSSRVVISRVLKKLELENKVSQKRHTIALTNL